MPWQQQTGLPIKPSVSLGQTQKVKGKVKVNERGKTESKSDPEWARLGTTQEDWRVRQTGQTAAVMVVVVEVCKEACSKWMQGDEQ